MMWQLRPKAKAKAEVEANPEIFFWSLRVDVCAWRRREMDWMPWGDHYKYKFTTKPTAEDVLRLPNLHPDVKKMVELFGVPDSPGTKVSHFCVKVMVGQSELTRMPVTENRKED